MLNANNLNFQTESMSYDMFLESKDKTLHRVIKRMTLIEISAFLFAISYNISTGLLLAAKINFITYVLLSLNYLYGKKVKNYKRSFMFNMIIVGGCLLTHQFFYGHITVLNNIWMVLFPIFICRYRGGKVGLKFTVVLSILVGVVLLTSFKFNPVMFYSIETTELNISAFVSLIFALFVSYNISNHFLKEESKHLTHIKESLEENEQLVSILTHDISNQLTIQKLSTHKLNKINSDKTNLKLVEKIDRSTDKLAEIVKMVRHTKILNNLNLKITQVDHHKILELLNTEMTYISKISNDLVSIPNNYKHKLMYFIDIDILIKGVLLPLLEYFLDCHAHSENDPLVVTVKESKDFNSIIISSISLDIFQTSSISHEKITTLNEKKIIIGIISAKKLIKRFGGEVKIVVNKAHHNELQLNFQKNERGHY